MIKRAVLLSSALVGTMVSSPLAFSAEPAEGEEEVVVTAQKRVERLQDVPISVATFSAGEMERSGITSGLDLTARVPGLYFGRSAAYAIPFLRGVGTNNVTAGDESSVATYIDGVYRPSMAGNALQFNNVERVEVLKGPQGTLFGRNATGGLINIITRTPTQDFAFRGSIGFDTFRATEIASYVAGGITDNLAADLAVFYRDQGKPYRYNAATGSRVGEDDSLSIRSKWVWSPSDRTKVTATFDYSNAVNTTNVVRHPFPGSVPLAALAGGVYSYDPEIVYNSYDPTSDLEQYGASLRVDVGFDGFDFASISAYRHLTYLNILETDATSADGVFSVVHPTLGVQSLPTLGFQSPLSEPNFFSQEVQLTSQGDGPFSWIVGAFYLSNDPSYDGFVILAGRNIRVGSPTYSTQDTTGFSGYAQASYDFGALSLTAGIRINYDERKFDGVSGATVTHVKSDWTEPTWRLAADYRVSEAFMLYASYSRGYKSGLYNINTITARTPVNPEILDAYEIGFKSDLADRRVRLNGAVFYYDYKDLQYQALAPGGGASILQNAAAATIKGFELEATADLTDAVRLFGGVSYLDAKYDSFPGAQAYAPAPPAGNRAFFVDASGLQLIRAPKWTMNIGGEFDFNLGESGRMTLSATYFYSSSFPFEPSNRLKQEAYGTLNASLTWYDPSDKYSAQLWIKNATDEVYFTNISPSGRGDTVAYGDPRTIGVRLSYEY